jgi:prepilin-type N-terminal cleavage/methylation domain-containing protein
MSRIPSNRVTVNNRVGFSLIEVLLVMIMVGMLLSVALPRVGRQINRDRAQRSAMVVHGMLDEAGAIAARIGTPVTVTLASGTLSIKNRATNAVYRSRPFGAGQDLRATVTLSPNTGIEIFPNGRGSAALTVTLTFDDYSTTVTRTATGIVRRQ